MPLRFFAELRRLGITLTRVQVPVSRDGITTRADGLGLNANHETVAIELKTTQMSLEAHRTTYNVCCANLPKLTNGLPNTGFWRSQLQCGFFMSASTTAVRGGGRA